MKYIEVNISLGQNDPFRDLLVDALGNEGPYDSFVETPDGLKAYVQETLFDEAWLKEQIEEIRSMTECTYSFEAMPDKNWNEEWEKQHKPVLVEAEGGKKVWVAPPSMNTATMWTTRLKSSPRCPSAPPTTPPPI
jgi:ribosomal protein L11 methyltransferase